MAKGWSPTILLLLGLLAAGIQGSLSAPKSRISTPRHFKLHDEVETQQRRLDTLNLKWCQDQTNDLCHALDDINLSLKDLRGELAYKSSRAPSSIKADLTRVASILGNLENQLTGALAE